MVNQVLKDLQDNSLKVNLVIKVFRVLMVILEGQELMVVQELLESAESLDWTCLVRPVKKADRE